MLKREIARRMVNWAQYNQWEALQPSPNWSLGESLEWMQWAIELARQSDPKWGSEEGVVEHCAHLALIRSRLSKLGRHD